MEGFFNIALAAIKITNPPIQQKSNKVTYAN